MSGDGTSGRLVLLRNAVVALGVAAAMGLWLAPRLYSWSYIFAGDRNGIDVVTHPVGYTGAGGTLRVSVGIDPTSAHAGEMVQSVRNMVATFNDLRTSTGNIVLGAGNNVPPNHLDFESVALHELGHALGLGHPNASTESGLPEEQRDYTKATKGSNGRFDLDPGADSVIGSSDDRRGDDVNLHWFRRSNNNPFTIAGRVDSTTYSRDTADLPAGHRFAANADRTVGRRLGVANTEAVMQQATFRDEAQRTLGHDDVAGLRHAMSGLDERSGTADDYTLVLEYAGLDANADIVIDFDDEETQFAVAKNRGRFLPGINHIALVEPRIYFNDSYNWFFNQDGGGGGGGGGPDLVVQSATVSDSTLTPGQSFTFSATVRNNGDRTSAPTTLNYGRRPRGSGSYGLVDSDPVGGLRPSGTSAESARLTAPTQAGSYEYIACVVAVAGESNDRNNCSSAVSVTVGPGGGGCTTDLGRVSGTVRRAGSWDGTCDSVYRPGRYARYYGFTLAGGAPVTIDLTSSTDPFMVLRSGAGTSGAVIEWDDDGGPGANSHISRTLAAGTYTVEATTFGVGRTGSFTLTLAVGADGTGPDLVVVAPAVSNARPDPGQAFTFSVAVRNEGDRASAPATLTYRQRTTGGSWTVVGTDAVSALSPAASSGESIGLNAPAQAGTYEYGACVSTVAGESDTGNNCSFAVRVVVASGPDLAVVFPTVSDSSPASGESFILSVAIRNLGGSESAAATLTFRQRRSGGSWTSVGTTPVGRLPPSGTSAEAIRLTAPAEAGSYDYGACVSTVAGESDTGNNCSEAVQVVVTEPPDLVVESLVVNDRGLTPGQSFRLSSTVRNQGGGASPPTTLTYRRRPSGGSWSDVRTNPVSGLPPSGTSRASIDLTAPTQAGAYDYGACVSTVAGESDTGNNCSEAVRVNVCALERLGSVTVGRRVAGSWGSGCESARRPSSYARYYSFVLTRAVEVGISLASSSDTYLFLLAGSGSDGTFVAANDDIGGGDTDSRIVRTLSAGTYTVEATTFSAGVTGPFTLRVSERRPFVDDPVVAGMSIRATHVTELRGRIDDLRVSAGLPRYSWVDRTIRPGATPVRAAHWQQLRTALDEVYDADGRRRPRYTEAIRAGDPIDADHVNELRRVVEGL